MSDPMYEEKTLVVGNWRSGIDAYTEDFVRDTEERKNLGMRQLSLEYTVSRLTELLNAYDDFACMVLIEIGAAPLSTNTALPKKKVTKE